MVSTARENEELVRRMNEEVWDEGNLDAIGEFVAEDFVGHNPAIPEPVHGPDGLRERIEMITAAWPDARLVAEDVVSDGEWVAQRTTLTGTHEGEFVGIEPTGREVEVAGASFQRVENGSFVEEWLLLDMLGLLAQIGVVDPPGGDG